MDCRDHPTWQMLIEPEAREWIERVRREGHSRASGQQRLDGILADIAKRRGQAAADQLRDAINKELARERAGAST